MRQEKRPLRDDLASSEILGPKMPRSQSSDDMLILSGESSMGTVGGWKK
jgi:hypothetical protein